MWLPSRVFPPHSRPSLRKYLLPRTWRGFGRDESGSLTIFSMFLILMMLMVGGLAVDFMRFETTRTKLQSTLDRAILASASLDQDLDPEDVVRDYFAKAGMSGFLVSVTVDQGLNYRQVSAEARMTMPTLLLKLLGIDELSVPATGTAQEDVEKIEISLVLDVSGSMVDTSDLDQFGNTRLYNLKIASKEFIDTLMGESNADNTFSISIIPYATQVNVGETLLSKYNVTSEHNYSNCVNFAASDFESASLSRADLLQRTGDFDPWYMAAPPAWRGRVCAPVDHRRIVPFSGNKVTLKDYIDDLEGAGNTSIDVGLKWGTTLLDPGSRSVVSDMITDGEIDAGFEGRPYDFGETGSIKVMVVMTDGVNTSQYYLKPGFRAGLSDVWLDPTSERYSIYDADRDQYYHAHPSNYNVDGNWRNEPFHTTLGPPVVRLTYPQLWHQMSLRWNAAYNYYAKDNQNYSTYQNWRYDPRSYVPDYTKDERMEAVCSAAKDSGILVFAIGFEVSNASAAKMSSCATTAAHFYRVEGVEISDAFASIAAHINNLRLVN